MTVPTGYDLPIAIDELEIHLHDSLRADYRDEIELHTNELVSS